MNYDLTEKLFTNTSGYSHTQFAFERETNVQNSDKDWNLTCPLGRLVEVLQKGLQYMEIEQHWIDNPPPGVKEGPLTQEDMQNSEHPCKNDFLLTVPHFCYGPNVNSNELADPIGQGHKHSELVNSSKTEEIHENKQDIQMDDHLTEIPSNEPSLYTEEKSAVIPDTVNQESTQWEGPSVEGSSLITDTISMRHAVTCADWQPTNPEKFVVGMMNADLSICKFGDDPKTFYGSNVESQDVTCIAWSHSGAYFACSFFNGSIELFNDYGSQQVIFQETESPVLTLKWSATDTYIAAGSADGGVVLYDCLKRSLVYFLDTCSSVLDIEWISTDAFVIADADGNLKIFNIGNKNPIFSIVKAHEESILSLRYHPHFLLLISSSSDATVKLWSQSNCESLQCMHTFPFNSPIECIGWNEGSGSPIFGIASNSIISLYNAISLQQLSVCMRHASPITSISFSNNGRLLATGDSIGSLCIWDCKLSSLIQELVPKNSSIATFANNESEEQINCLKWSPDDKHLIVGKQTQELVICTVSDKKFEMD
ncbi:Set3 complex subunit Hif2 [Schizosaccharomyces octosporus yFS286]|uniref:Set3 complex subunit Hif2 n=1 Tax=Schizosaccharomyces octosporus (strain yFS286) TaxID=483514 RepID=S9PRG7_SCHOY|nr:Set3 complex subunit Hif2 [Schizosaccharomyces octosporus yFS286]EPX71776.1 Set3 complex subunit Hif2 [Schizosaccharomyces octosporus yFS286]